MHIRIIARCQAPSGGWMLPGQILDLPEAEAGPLVEAGVAEDAAAPVPESEPELPLAPPEA